MPIVVTGGAGFVGLSTIEAALRIEEEVALVSDRPVPKAVLDTLRRLPGCLHIHQADVRDAEAMKSILDLHRPDVLFPLAALTPSPHTEDTHPDAVIDVNLMGFVTQMRAARDAGVRRVIVPASGGVYGDSAYDFEWLDETTPCRPNSIYGTTKYAVETTGLRLGALWGIETVAARIGGVFGAWERQTGSREMFGPHYRMLRLAMAGEDIVLPATFPATSSIYSRDLAEGLLHLARLSTPKHSVYNVCTGRNWADDLPHWAEALCILYPGVSWRRADVGERSNITITDSRDRGRLDNSRLTESGWLPAYLGAEAYADYARWLSENPGCF